MSSGDLAWKKQGTVVLTLPFENVGMNDREIKEETMKEVRKSNTKITQTVILTK